MAVLWECKEQMPCAIGDMQILGDNQPPMLQVYGFTGLPDSVDCKPHG